MARKPKLDWDAMMDIGSKVEARLREIATRKQHAEADAKLKRMQRASYAGYVNEQIANLDDEDRLIEKAESLEDRKARLRDEVLLQTRGFTSNQLEDVYVQAYDETIPDDDLDGNEDAVPAIRELNRLSQAIGQFVQVPAVRQVHDVMPRITRDVARWATRIYGITVSARHVQTCHDLFRNGQKRLGGETRDYQPQRNVNTEETER